MPRHSSVDRRSKRYAARQFVSDVEHEPLPNFVTKGTVMANEVFERGTGTVKFFNAEKGFGFCRRDKGPDVFVHVNALKRSGLDEKSIKTGDKLEFDLIPVEGKGPKAANIKIVGGI